MEKSTKCYNFINIVILAVTTLLFLCYYRKFSQIFYGMDIPKAAILGITIFLVHFVKAGRLYFAFYESGFEFKAYLKTYCKVTPVSMVMSWKLGEFFRMYCYGRQLGNVIKGVIIILLDRFMDTVALVTMIVLVWISNGGYMPSFVYLLLLFLGFVLLLYFVFSGVYQYWKGYLLHAKATQNKLSALKMLETMNMLYQEIESVVRGKGVILYFMSLVAWGAEIISIILLDGLSGNGRLNQVISDYLTAAMLGKQSLQLKRFVSGSVLLLMSVYVFVKIIEMIGEKRVNEIWK